jgi:alpha-L-rhamnosidase
MENPLGLDVLHPRLSWKLESIVPAQTQTAYRILVSSTPDKLQQDVGDLWDSGKVEK